MLVGNTDRCALKHTGQCDDHFLDLVRKHIEARDDDHVLLAIDDLHEAPEVHHADIAGLEETIGGHRTRRLLGLLPVALHDLRPADADLAALTRRHIVAGVIADRDFNRADRQADRAIEGGTVDRVDGSDRAGLGQAETLTQRHAGDCQPFFGYGLLSCHATACCEHQLREIELGKLGIVGERIEKRVEARKIVDRMLGKHLDQVRDVARIRHQQVAAARLHAKAKAQCKHVDVIERQSAQPGKRGLFAVLRLERALDWQEPGFALKNGRDHVAMREHRAL